MPEHGSLNGFQLINLLMTGQTSQVWQVMRESDHRVFALKLLLPEAVRKPEHRRFLAHEARVGMALDHKTIIKIWDYFPDRDNPHFVMEYFPSINMKLRICYRQALVHEKAREIITQLATGLGWMHLNKWVHKDVKPDNVLVNDRGEIRIIDFALAEPILPPWRRLLAGKRPVMGTRSYMSPEQIRGQPLDARSDLYSLGVVLFEMLTRRLPLVATSPSQLLRKHLYEKPPSARSYNPAVTVEMDELIQKLLAKKKEDRFADTAEFLAEFQRVQIFKG